ncbi:MAG: SPOR domain-containing protein [Duncaniella sp.]|nr:SPOR domain-containing protein [Duncaniella sp.]
MKRLHLLLAVIVAFVALAACKTTEANYRTAYDSAKRQQQESTGLDSTIYGRIRSQAANSKLVVGADSLPLKREYVGYTPEGGSSRENLLRYNVVVGQFKQVFNARQMRERLIAAGYDGAMIVNTREPLYYVVALSVSTPEEALAAWQRVTSDHSLVLRSPLPFILQPARYR